MWWCYNLASYPSVVSIKANLMGDPESGLILNLDHSQKAFEESTLSPHPWLRLLACCCLGWPLDSDPKKVMSCKTKQEPEHRWQLQHKWRREQSLCEGWVGCQEGASSPEISSIKSAQIWSNIVGKIKAKKNLTRAVTTSSKAEAKAFSTEFSFCNANIYTGGRSP